MNGLRKKVMLSAVVLVFAFIATIGSTYAWFTVSNVVTVNSFVVNVESSEALLMRVWDGEVDQDGATYSSYSTSDNGVDFWTLDDFSNVLDLGDSSEYDDLSTWLLSPVTCLSGETLGDTNYTGSNILALRKPSGTFLTPDATLAGDPGRTLGTAAAAENTTAGGYIKLQFWMLKPSGTNTDIVLSSYSVDDGISLQSWEEAIWLGTYFDDTSTQNIFGADLDTGFTWADNTVPGYSSVADLNSMVGSASVTSGITSTVIAQLPTANVPELITVYIWAEGWDADSTNDIMGASFTINLEFTLVQA